MKAVIFNTKSYDRIFLTEANKEFGIDLTFIEDHLNMHTVKLAYDYDVVCVFVNDCLDRDILTLLAKNGVRMIALRCAGFNNVDIQAAADLKIAVARVPAYSPHGVAEHTVALMLNLNRKIHKAYNRVHEGNFSLDGLLGFELYNRTVGIIGTGKIGSILTRIMTGFGAKVLLYDPIINNNCVADGGVYVTLDEIYQRSDIISLHLPLSKDTHHLVNEQSIARMKDGVMLINTSRGGLINARDVIKGLKSGRIGFLGLDVYEEETGMFFEDMSGKILQDDIFARLLTFSNVVITGHQAFFTKEAMMNIATTTLNNMNAFECGYIPKENCVTVEAIRNNAQR
jgi:D-lactate dehydrogenase